MFFLCILHKKTPFFVIFIISKIEHYDLLRAIHNCGSEFWKNKEETKKKKHTEFCQKYSLLLFCQICLHSFIHSTHFY